MMISVVFDMLNVSERNYMKKNLMELGRSMVEMLGVLTVIGVLSIVGIAGYKKAMNKIKANELMNIAVKVYNENLARKTAKPSVAANSTTGALCSNAFPIATSNATANRCNNNNLGWEKPNWATLDTFTIYTNIYKFSPTTNSYNVITFYGLNDCAICDEIAAMSEEYQTGKYRLPKSQTDELTSGILIYNCYTGSDTKPDQKKCF